MKIRNGFVSNSSSSSFVVYLPKSFDLDKFLENLDYSKIDFSDVLDELDDFEGVENEFVKEKVKEYMDEFIRNSNIDEYDDYSKFNTLSEILDPYIISEIEVSSDCGSIVLIDPKVIENIENLK